jgi:hypothetical protein
VIFHRINVWALGIRGLGISKVYLSAFWVAIWEAVFMALRMRG